MTSTRRKFLQGALATGAAALLPPFCIGQESPPSERNPASLDDQVRRQALKTLNEWYKIDTSRVDPASVKVERLVLDLNGFREHHRYWPEKVSGLAEKYSDAGSRVWHGFVSVDAAKYSGMFVLNDVGEVDSTRMIDRVDANEEAFIRAALGLPTAYTDGRTAYIDRIYIDGNWVSFDPFARYAFEDTVSAAAASSLLKWRVDSGVVERARWALLHSGSNAQYLQGALRSLDSDGSALALHLLSLMDSPAYGFGGSRGKKADFIDIESQSPVTFYENVYTTVRALKRYPWAREQAERDFDNFVSAVLCPRWSEEFDCGRRLHLQGAAHELVKDCKSLEDAAERVARASSKLFKYGQPFSGVDGNWMMFLASRMDRCEAMAMFGGLLLRSVGIPAVQQFSPWWADRDDNHAWIAVPYVKQDGSRGELTFLTGDREWLPDGKYNMQTFSKHNPTLPPTNWKNRELHGTAGCAKVFNLAFVPGGQRQDDVTSHCTETLDVVLEIAPDYAGDKVGLAVYNSGGFRVVDSGSVVDANGRLSFRQVGCVPLTDERTKRVGEGLLYAMANLSRNRLIGSPFVVFPDGTRSHAKELDARKLPMDCYVHGFEPHVAYSIKVWANGTFFDVGSRTADRDGGILAPVEDNALLLAVPTGASIGRPYAIRTVRPPIPDVEKASVLEAIRH